MYKVRSVPELYCLYNNVICIKLRHATEDIVYSYTVNQTHMMITTHTASTESAEMEPAYSKPGTDRYIYRTATLWPAKAVTGSNLCDRLIQLLVVEGYKAYCV